ncbi:MAG TPA: dihydrofolate reductase family protein [Actinophytocola sp.]|jgi:dihydrofolate reductase|uniref:dihydrofolate reductase family protein n=1 Tax=Actinophytocola sp. TaxID=1872138 RepID=UPI002F95AC27
MSTIVVDTFLTLDGVMQAPGGQEEDPESGFTHGGWQGQFFDDETGEFVGKGIAKTEGLLLGRKTYDIFAGFWPHVPDDHPDAQIARKFDAIPKYVASRTLKSVEWQNSMLLGDDVPGAVVKLKEQPGGEIHVIGSGDLAQTLIRHGLVDEYRLIIYPLVLGTGKRLFADGVVPTGLELVESHATPGGAVICVYRPGGKLTYSSMADR